VINTNLPPILHRFRDIAFDKSKIAIFGYPSRRWSDSLHHIIVSDISLKTRNSGLHFYKALTTFEEIALKAIESLK